MTAPQFHKKFVIANAQIAEESFLSHSGSKSNVFLPERLSLTGSYFAHSPKRKPFLRIYNHKKLLFRFLGEKAFAYPFYYTGKPINCKRSQIFGCFCMDEYEIIFLIGRFKTFCVCYPFCCYFYTYLYNICSSRTSFSAKLV